MKSIDVSYLKEKDITVIFDHSKDDIVVGYYHGEPTDEMTARYIGSLVSIEVPNKPKKLSSLEELMRLMEEINLYADDIDMLDEVVANQIKMMDILNNELSKVTVKTATYIRNEYLIAALKYCKSQAFSSCIRMLDEKVSSTCTYKILDTYIKAIENRQFEIV